MNKPEWIKEIEEREAKATPGPWKCYSARFSESDEELGVWYHIADTKNCISWGNGAFIENARTDVPRLLSALNKACEALEKLRIHAHNIEGCTHPQSGHYVGPTTYGWIQESREIIRSTLEAINLEGK